jgi:hypothetical protein
MSNMAVVIYQSLGSSYVGEVGVAHHFSVLGFVCGLCNSKHSSLNAMKMLNKTDNYQIKCFL